MLEAHEEKKAFKDWFDKTAAQQLAEQIYAVYPEFDRIGFVKKATHNINALEMSERIQQFAKALKEKLPKNIPTALEIIRKSFPPAVTDCNAITQGWLQWPIGQFISDYGIDHFNESFETMVELTQRFSAEFAIRPFYETYPDRTIQCILSLLTHKNPHVRRWCSEGLRPRLPWGRKLRQLIQDPSPILPILNTLKNDPEIYVRKSVANCLNDITKDHPDRVIQICQNWQNEKNEIKTNVEWVIKHGLRTLIKDGNPNALKLIGYNPPKNIEVSLNLSSKSINIGESIEMELHIENCSTKTQKILIDYAVRYQRQNNKVSAKVFKWKHISLAAKQKIVISKKHPMKITTVRALYPGTHSIEIQINGTRLTQKDFNLAV